MPIVRSAVISGVRIRQLSPSDPRVVASMATTPTQLVYVHGAKSVTIINFGDSWCDHHLNWYHMRSYISQCTVYILYYILYIYYINSSLRFMLYFPPIFSATSDPGSEVFRENWTSIFPDPLYLPTFFTRVWNNKTCCDAIVNQRRKKSVLL